MWRNLRGYVTAGIYLESIPDITSTNQRVPRTRNLQSGMDDVHVSRNDVDVRHNVLGVKVVGRELVGGSDKYQVRFVVVKENVCPVQVLFEYVNGRRVTDVFRGDVLKDNHRSDVILRTCGSVMTQLVNRRKMLLLMRQTGVVQWSLLRHHGVRI